MKLREFLLVKICSLFLIGTVILSCQGSPTAQDSVPADSVYTFRGVVVSLPDTERRGSTLMIHHEAIAEFKNELGKIVGMEEMTMPFFPKDLSLFQGILKGDEIECVVEIRWKGEPREVITSVKKLQPGTVHFQTPS